MATILLTGVNRGIGYETARAVRCGWGLHMPTAVTSEVKDRAAQSASEVTNLTLHIRRPRHRLIQAPPYEPAAVCKLHSTYARPDARSS